MIGKFKDFTKKIYNNLSIRSSVFASFTISSVLVVIIIAATLSKVFSNEIESISNEEKMTIINQVNQTLDSHLRNMMKTSDSIYYRIIKNTNLDENSINEKLGLVFDINKDHIANIALFDTSGNLIDAYPPAKVKDNDTVNHKWFKKALDKSENLHFSLPTVENIFVDNEKQYNWVISLSRYVEITKGGETTSGILLINIKYAGIQQLFTNIKLGNSGYIYLIDESGNTIYHPNHQLINSNLYIENNISNSKYQDGVYTETFLSEQRNVIVKSVGYTGWKLIGVTIKNELPIYNFQNKTFIVFFIILFIFIFSLMNLYISSKVTDPIKELELSVLALEDEFDEDAIYVGGSHEVQHLGNSIKKMVRQMNVLMKDIVKEHDEKRKSELDVLQSQINPHFLYNTLDIIVWMVENENPSDAVRVVTALARLFRISLSRGKSIIPVKDELEHIRNYLMIQDMRFKNKFTYTINPSEDTLYLLTIKLIVQPIVENAIYHGMEFMDGEGRIEINAFIKNDDLFITIKDNGFGIEEEVLKTLLQKKDYESKKGSGSGIGLNNIHERIQITFGYDYGLIIESELDVGTTVIIHLPAITKENVHEKVVI